MKGYVYTITNVVNGKKYIGSTTNPSRRWDTHQRSLNNGSHHSVYLQRAVDKHGLENFIFEVVSESENYKIIEEELIAASYDNNYNVSKKSSGGDLISYHPDRDSIIERMRQSLLERYSDPEHRMKYSRPGELNPNWKGGISIHKCECGNEKSPNANTCGSCRNRNGANNPFYGKKHSSATIDVLRSANMGKMPVNVQKIIIDGIEYSSQAEAARTLGVSSATINYRLNSPRFPTYIRPS